MSSTQVTPCAKDEDRDPIDVAIELVNSRLFDPSLTPYIGRYQVSLPIRLTPEQVLLLQQCYLKAGWNAVQVIVWNDRTGVMLYDKPTTDDCACVHDGIRLTRTRS